MGAMRKFDDWLDSPSWKGGVWLDWVPQECADAWEDAELLIDAALAAKGAA